MPSLGPHATAGPRRPDAATAAGLLDAEPDAARYDVGELQRRLLDRHLRRGERRWRSHARARQGQRVLRYRHAVRVGDADLERGWRNDRGRRQVERGRRAGRHLRRLRRRLPGTVPPGARYLAGIRRHLHWRPVSALGTRADARVVVRALRPVQHELDRHRRHRTLGQLARPADLQRHRGRRNEDESRAWLAQRSAPVPHRLAAGANRLFSRRCAGGNPRDADDGVDAARGRQRLQRVQRHHRG